MMKPKKNPVTKLVVAGVKAAAKAAGKKPSLKAAQKAKPLATPKSAVKVKLPAKTKSNKFDSVKQKYRQELREYKDRERGGDWVNENPEPPSLPKPFKKPPIKINSQQNLKKKAK